MRTLCLLVLLAGGCAPPPHGAEHAIGVIKDSLVPDALAVLEREGIRVQEGGSNLGVTGIRVFPEDAPRATRILLEWRRGKDPGAFLTRDEFQMQLDDR
jgi:hypothetical protein